MYYLESFISHHVSITNIQNIFDKKAVQAIKIAKDVPQDISGHHEIKLGLQNYSIIT
jgi:hypothetical protein